MPKPVGLDRVSHLRQVANARFQYKIGATGSAPPSVREHVESVWGWLRTNVLLKVEWEYDRTRPLMSDMEIEAATDLMLLRLAGEHLMHCDRCWTTGGLPNRSPAAVLTRIIRRQPAGPLLDAVIADTEAAEAAGHKLKPRDRRRGRHAAMAVMEIGQGYRDEWRMRMLDKIFSGKLVLPPRLAPADDETADV